MGKENCLFCRIAKREIPTKVVLEDPRFMAFEDVNPQAPVHVLIIPKEHIEKISNLDERHATLVGTLVLAAKHIAREKGVQESGYRIIMNCNRDAGQAIAHLHIHLLGGRKFTWPPG